MALIQDIQEQVKEAMKSHDDQRRDALRLILNALKTEEKEKRITLTPEMEVSILTSEAKKRREAIEGYELAGAEDRAARERYELELITGFLPAQLTEEEVRKMVSDLKAELNIESKKDQGRLMKALMPKIKGKFSGNDAKKIVDEMI